MEADEEYERIVRREAAERVDRILQAIRGGAPEGRWDVVYQNAHTLAGIAPDLDPELAAGARELAQMLQDAHGRRLEPTGEDETRARNCARRLSARLDGIEDARG